MPLPPVSVDSFRRWSSDRWRDVTDATIGRVQSGLWDMQAEDAISRLRPLELPEPEPIYQPPEPAYEPPPPPPPAPPAPAPQSPLDAVRAGVGSTLSGIGGRARSALSGAQDWASRAEDTISGMGAELGGGFAGAQAAPLPSLDAPSTYEPSTPLEQAGALASRIPRGAAAPVQGVVGAMGEAVEGGRRAVPGPLGTVLGGLGAVPAGFGQLQEQAALGVGFTPEQAEAQGRLAGIVSPGLGGLEQGSRRLGQLATAGLGGVGAVKGALETPGGLEERAGGALEGGLTWAQFGQPVGAVADLATRLPYRFGQAAVDATDDAALGIRRGQRMRMPPLSPEQQAQRARDGAAEQRVFDAIARLWRSGPEGEAAADDLRFLAVGKGEAGEAAARDYLAGKGLADVLPAPPPGIAEGVPAGDGLLGLARRATEPLMARGAITPGERAFDVAAGSAGGVAGAATAEEDATWQERAARGALGASLGGLAGANVRQLGRVGQRALGDGEALGVAAGRTPRPGEPPRQLDLTEAPEAELTEEARRVLATPRPTDPAAATNWDRLVAFMTSNALSNPRSLTGNALGGVEQTLGRFGRYTGQGRPQDAWRELGAWWASKGDVADATWKAFWQGERPPRVGEAVGATAETSAQAFAGPKGVLATPASRLAGATDAFFSMLSRAGGEAVADARGLTGEARDAFIKEQVQQSVLAGTPSFVTKNVGELKSLINSPDLGDKLKAAAALVYVPFARVPEQIWKQGLYRTISPLTDLPAAGYHALRGNPQKARDAAQRWATNSAIAGPVLWQVGEGNLTGSGPADPNKRRQLEATGWRPNSVRLGDEWYSYDWLGPLGLQMNALATAAETWAEAGKEPDATAYKKIDKVVNRMGQLAGDEFYLRNFFDLMGAVKDGRMTDSLAKTAAEAGARLIPYSAAQNWLAGGTDPYEREPETALERVQARTVLRQGVPARIDPTTGEPQRRGGTPAERLGGFGRPTVEATPLAAEVARLRLGGQDVSVPAFTPGEKYKEVEQTRPQRRVLQQVYGSEVAAATRELLASPDYQQADDKEKARLLRRQITVARARADVLAGDRVARSPKGKAELAYLAVPHYEGMGRNLSPEAIRLENLRTAEAKARLADARKKYPGNPDKGETEFLRADREAYRRAERYRVDAETLAAKKQAIEREHGVDLP